jgi:hypothetical protein
MNLMKPISAEEYEAFYRELYSTSDGGLVFSQFRVPLDSDPSLNPKGMNEKIAKVQGLKDRLVVIMNRALKSKAYWDTAVKKVAAKYEAEFQRAMLDVAKQHSNAEMRKAAASDIACRTIVADVFRNEGKYEDQLSAINKKLAEAIAFYSEVKNIYDNLDASSMNLAVQLKSVMVNARIGGEGWIQGEPKNGSGLD